MSVVEVVDGRQSLENSCQDGSDFEFAENGLRQIEVSNYFVIRVTLMGVEVVFLIVFVISSTLNLQSLLKHFFQLPAREVLHLYYYVSLCFEHLHFVKIVKS